MTTIPTESQIIAKLEDYAPILTLVFEDAGDIGILIATKQKDAAERFIPINVSTEIDPRDEGDTDDVPQEEKIGFALVGVGNYGELKQLGRILRRLADDRLTHCGYHLGFHFKVLQDFLAYLIYTNHSPKVRPYNVELSLVCITPDRFTPQKGKRDKLNKDSAGVDVNIYRIKYDGDYQPVNPFSVIGGYRKIDDVSVRKRALQMLREAYRKKLPTRKAAHALADRILRHEEGDSKEWIINPLNPDTEEKED